MKTKLGIILGSIGAAALAPATFAADWVTLPSFTSFQASSTDFASGMFGSLITLAAVIVGVAVAVMILNKLVKIVIGGVKRITGGGRRGGRRGRR